MTKKEMLKLIATMDEAEMEKVAIKALKGTTTIAETVEEAKPVKAKATKLNATDVAVGLVAEGKQVTFGNLPRDTYGALKAKAKELGGTYDKAIKGFVFATKAKANQFAKITVITAEERNEIRASWGWK